MGSNYPGREEQNYQNNQNSNSKTYNREEIEFPSDADYRRTVPPYAEGMDVRERRVITHAKKSNTKTIILICVLVEILVVLATVTVFLLNKKQDNKDIVESAEVQSVETSKFKRFTTFNPGYNYSKLPGVANSVEASDKEFQEMRDFVVNYNSEWLGFVNYGDNSLFNHLRSGTKAYINATNFKRAGLTEEFVSFEVNDVRKTGNTYYVWTHEILNKYYSTGTKRVEYHWIYIVEEDSRGCYVERYEHDPYYK